MCYLVTVYPTYLSCVIYVTSWQFILLISRVFVMLLSDSLSYLEFLKSIHIHQFGSVSHTLAELLCFFCLVDIGADSSQAEKNSPCFLNLWKWSTDLSSSDHETYGTFWYSVYFSIWLWYLVHLWFKVTRKLFSFDPSIFGETISCTIQNYLKTLMFYDSDVHD